MDARYPRADPIAASRNRNLQSQAHWSHAGHSIGGPSYSTPGERHPANTRQDKNPQLTLALRNLLQCQTKFFSQVDADYDAELQQVLRNARGRNMQEKREIRRWALDYQIADVLDRIRDPKGRLDVLNRQMTNLLSFADDDGGDNMYVKMGFEIFSDAIMRQEIEFEPLESARIEQERLDDILRGEPQPGRRNPIGRRGERVAAGRGSPPNISRRVHSSQPSSRWFTRKES